MVSAPPRDPGEVLPRRDASLRGLDGAGSRDETEGPGTYPRVTGAGTSCFIPEWLVVCGREAPE